MRMKKQVVKLSGNEIRKLEGDALPVKLFLTSCETGNVVNQFNRK